MTNVINTTTPSHVAAAAAAIASTSFASHTTIAAISITGPKNVGAALAAASAPENTIRFKTTIDGGIEDRHTIGSVTTEIT